MQALDGDNEVVYGGCHCGDWVYETTQYDGLSPGQSTVTWTQADKISLVGAWRADTGKLHHRVRAGVEVARRLRGLVAEGRRRRDLWAGGRSPPRSGRTAPTSGWAASSGSTSARTAPRIAGEPVGRLTGDDGHRGLDAGSTSGATYEVLRNDRVVALSTGSRSTCPTPTPVTASSSGPSTGWATGRPRPRSRSRRPVRSRHPVRPVPPGRTCSTTTSPSTVVEAPSFSDGSWHPAPRRSAGAPWADRDEHRRPGRTDPSPHVVPPRRRSQSRIPAALRPSSSRRGRMTASWSTSTALRSVGRTCRPARSRRNVCNARRRRRRRRSPTR